MDRAWVSGNPRIAKGVGPGSAAHGRIGPHGWMAYDGNGGARQGARGCRAYRRVRRLRSGRCPAGSAGRPWPAAQGMIREIGSRGGPERSPGHAEPSHPAGNRPPARPSGRRVRVRRSPARGRTMWCAQMSWGSWGLGTVGCPTVPEGRPPSPKGVRRPADHASGSAAATKAMDSAPEWARVECQLQSRPRWIRITRGMTSHSADLQRVRGAPLRESAATLRTVHHSA